MKPLVAIVGRPNVGKSTLFNRLIGGRVAIVEGRPRITRDRIYGNVEWLGREFILVDTGGLDFSKGPIHHEVRKQAQVAMEEATVIYFVIDGREGITALDEEIGGVLYKRNKKVILVVNKMEWLKDYKAGAVDFYRLGFSDIFPISADHGNNIGDLLDATMAYLPHIPEEEEQEALRITIVGKPNAGKSSLMNALLGEERVIVDAVPGTTRDAVDVFFSREDLYYRIVDTAGIRRKAKVSQSVEHYSVLRALRAIDASHIVILLLDVQEGLNRQDKRIANYIIRQGKALLIALNKVDLLSDPMEYQLLLQDRINYDAPFLSFAPLVAISALYGTNLDAVWEKIQQVNQGHTRQVATGPLNRVIKDTLMMNQPPGRGKRVLKIYYGTQVHIRPPHFLLFVNDPKLSSPSYQRYLENSLRQAFDFTGTPLILTMKKRS